MQNCISETAKTLHDCFSVFVLVFYFKFGATTEIKRCFISLLFQLCKVSQKLSYFSLKFFHVNTTWKL